MENPSFVLVIEDNPDDVLFIERAFKTSTLHYRLEVVSDGATALSYLFNADPIDQALPDLIFLDLHLPKISGLEVLFQIKSHPQTKKIPTIVLTSSEDEEQIDECYDMGANSYIHKSLNANEFMQALQETAYYWLKHNRRLKTSPTEDISQQKAE